MPATCSTRVAYSDVGTAHVDYRDSLGNNDPTLIQGNYWEQGDPDGDNKGVITQGNHLLANPSAAPSRIVDNAGVEPAYRWVLYRPVGGVRRPRGAVPGGDVRRGRQAVRHLEPDERVQQVAGHGYMVTRDGRHAPFRTTIDASAYRRTAYAAVGGLTDGTAYTVTVTATNWFGASQPSLAAAPVTPGPLAGKLAPAPTGARACPTADAVSLHWTPPTDHR